MFRFKEFTIRQERCPMKVGTDGVLLGAWADLPETACRLLDIGTGTGLIALMLAQRAPQAEVWGVDIDDVAQARENGAASLWGDRVRFAQIPVQEFSDGVFDRIVSNPPFFVDSLTCPDAGRTTARHAVTLSYSDLCDAVLRLLAPCGRFSLILPTPEAEHFLAQSRGRLYLTRRTDVRTTPRRAPKRLLLEFAAEPAGDLRSSELVIGTGEHEQYTAEYRALTRDFYLKF